MKQIYPGEQWKAIRFDFPFTNDCRIEISNFGRLRTYNKVSDGNIINGSMVNGYRIIRLKFHSPRDKETHARFDYLKGQVDMLASKLKLLKNESEATDSIAATENLLTAFKTNLQKELRQDLRSRTVYYHSLIHRLVADYFLQKPRDNQTIVAHLDYDKLNNRSANLKWMTPEENYEHQRSSPFVINQKLRMKQNGNNHSTHIKLSVTKVMLLKKLLSQGKPMHQLVKIFKVTDTQIFRIKRGENWSEIEAAN